MAITAGCAVVTPLGALVLGLLGGVLVYLAEEFVLHVLRVDDPVNVVAAHGVAGAWGTIGLAFVAPEAHLPLQNTWAQAGVQALGVVSVFAWGFGALCSARAMLAFRSPASCKQDLFKPR